MDVFMEMLKPVALLAVMFFAGLCFVLLWRRERKEGERAEALMKASEIIAATSQQLTGQLNSIRKNQVRKVVQQRKEQANAAESVQEIEGRFRADDHILKP